MAIPTLEDAKATLAPYHREIRRVVEEAWAEWREVEDFRAESGHGAIGYTRTICNYIFDAIARRAIPSFGVMDAVRVDIEAQTFKLYIKGIVLRFKKGGDDKLGQNIPTLAALLFEDAGGLLPGPMPGAGKVEVIWLPNAIWTALDRVLVIARDGDRLIWEYDIEPEAGTGVVIQFPTPPDRGPEPDAGDLVKPKAKPTDKPQEQ
jgi:hypothetical protein